MTKELEEYTARLCDSLNRVTAADYESYGIEFHEVIKSAQALLRVIDALGDKTTFNRIFSRYDTLGMAEAHTDFRQQIIDAILNEGGE